MVFYGFKGDKWVTSQTHWISAWYAAPSLSVPDNESMLHPAYDSGDGVHPNDEGYRLMAEAVAIDQLTGSPGLIA